MAGHGPGMGAPAGGGGGREVNTFQLCKMGQETVQEIVAKTLDTFNLLKNIQLPNGTMSQPTPTNQEKQAKLQENYNNIIVMFKKLRLLYDKCNQMCSGMEQNLTEEIIPWKDAPDKLKDMVQPNSQERLHAISNERKELIERVRAKNQQLRQIMDQLRALIWDINSMMPSDSQKGQETSSIPLQPQQPPLPQPPVAPPPTNRPFP
ncbi:mediator of RNA polymerase II transcription subunit 30-like [Amphiura filiformis]|uniref:mediator of RNA polymerase II transcription subunit 30-like n=1 Tax=Amphiura filiformis TaxID=82378 RepID=UPI003B224117